MTFRYIAAARFVLLLCCCLPSKLARIHAAEVESDKPNFVIVFADDLGYADVGCFGATQIRTPHIDRLAREGVRFTDFYAQPVCGPSRTALMTGCYPLRVAEVGNLKRHHPAVHPREITMAEVLASAGYRTGCFGKWDMAEHRQRGFRPALMPNEQGFDYFFGTPSSNDSFVDLYRNKERIAEKADMSTLTQRYTAEVKQFIDRNQDKPFLVYLAHTMPHVRLASSTEFAGKSKRGRYGDTVEEIDHGVGEILAKLAELKLTSRTYLIFTSDNGPWLSYNQGVRDGTLPGDRGGSAGPLRSGKVSTWEGGIRVPMIVWSPGHVPAGKTCKAVTATIDLLPTFATLAGAKLPVDRTIDGQNITPLFAGRFDETDSDRVFYGYFRAELQTVRQGKWKLHLPGPTGWPTRNRHIAKADDRTFRTPLLFDLEADIGETNDVAADNPAVVKQLQELADKARRDIGDYDQIGAGARFFDEGAKRPDIGKPPQRI